MGYFSQDKSQDRPNSRINGAVTDAKPQGVTGTAAAGKNLADTVSTLGPGMVIIGNIVCEGVAHIFGCVVGDIEAKQVVIGDGAKVEGNVTAHDITINGVFNGTVHGHNVKLRGAAVVDGEIFSNSLTVEENVQFEGVSRRLEKSVELPAAARPAVTRTAPVPMLGSGPIPVPV